MISFSLRRALQSLPTLLALAALVFFLLRLAPGGPFDGDKAWPPEIEQNILHRYHLDKPIWSQFIYWMANLVRGDFGTSFQYLDKPVTEIIGEALPHSLALGLGALLLACFFGILLGVVAAWKQNSLLDSSSMFLAIAGVSLPNYLLASVLVLLFAVQLQWLPPALFDGPSSLILPIVTLASRPLAMIARMTRASVLEVTRNDYIRTAYAKGLDDRSVVFKHVLKNSLIPVVTLLGPITANLLTGSFVVEIVFQLPGLGKHFVAAVLNRDYPLVMGVTMIYGVFLTTSNLLVDLAYGWVDPRVRQT